MQYSRPMIDLVMQIRKFVPADLKPDIKLANPELFATLIDYYHQKNCTVTNALIKELLFLAGEEWASQLTSEHQDDVKPAPVKPQSVRVYRGQVQVIDKADNNAVSDTISHASPTKKKASKKIYRGQVIYEDD